MTEELCPNCDGTGHDFDYGGLCPYCEYGVILKEEAE